MGYHNRKYLENYRRFLRRNLTPSEAKLWNVLKGKRLGRKFRRQHSIGNYIVDFYCPEEKLVIEVDGVQHYTPYGELSDEERDKYLEQLDIKVLRIPNEVVQYKIEIAIDAILNEFSEKY